MDNSYSNEQSITEFNKFQPKYLLGFTIQAPIAHETSVEKDKNIESIENEETNSALGEQLSQFPKRIINNDPRNEYIITNISIENEEAERELREIKFHFNSLVIPRKVFIDMIKILKDTLKKVQLMIIKITPKKKNPITNEIFNIKSEENIEENNSINPCYPTQNKNNQNITKISLRGNNNITVNRQVNTIKDTIVIKFLEMFLSAMYILVLELQPKRMSYVFDFYSRLICIFGFCGSLILLGNHIKEKNNESVNLLFKWDLIFCIFMFLSYVWLTFAIIFMYHFYITYPLSSLVVFGFLMQLIFFLDIKNNLICRRNN